VATVRFLADANLNKDILTGCRRIEPAFDFVATSDAGLEGKPDEEVLLIAAAMGRILITHDRKTMPGYFGKLIVTGGHTPGLFLVHQTRPIARVIDSLLLVWSASDSGEWVDRIVEIPF
jgi:predicted nuclease of predicted toxin-antitoxin system